MSENTNFYLRRQLPFFAAQTSARASRAEEGDFFVCRCLEPNTITLNNKLNRKPGCEDLAAGVKKKIKKVEEYKTKARLGAEKKKKA